MESSHKSLNGSEEKLVKTSSFLRLSYCLAVAFVGNANGTMQIMSSCSSYGVKFGSALSCCHWLANNFSMRPFSSLLARVWLGGTTTPRRQRFLLAASD